MVFVNLKRNCFGVSGTVLFRFAGLRSAGKTVRSSAGGRRSTPFTGAGEMATPAAPMPRSSSSSVIRPPNECPMIIGAASRPRMIRS
jgi:hypothetical protein